MSQGSFIGEIKTADEIDYKSRGKYIWSTCITCGIEQWTRTKDHYTFKCKVCIQREHKTGNFKKSEFKCVDCGKERTVRDNSHGDRCCSCAAKRRLKRNGRFGNGYGYVLIRVNPGDFFHSMTGSRNYVMEHRLVMAKHLNRCLLPWEVVHHINGIKDDNRLENLVLLKCQSYHTPSTRMEQELKKQKILIDNLKKRIILLEAENELLKAGRNSDVCRVI